MVVNNLSKDSTNLTVFGFVIASCKGLLNFFPKLIRRQANIVAPYLARASLIENMSLPTGFYDGHHSRW